MRTHIDLTPYRRATVGFDRLFDMLESGVNSDAAETYPPFNLEQQGDDAYRITLAVAGFRPDEIEITAKQNLLVVAGRKTEESAQNFLHRGIAARSFERQFALGDYVQVRGADLRDGLLSIDLVREIPEAMKPRRIEIGGDEKPSQIADRREPAAGATEQEHATA